jgi:hypothetical protein
MIGSADSLARWEVYEQPYKHHFESTAPIEPTKLKSAGDVMNGGCAEDTDPVP